MKPTASYKKTWIVIALCLLLTCVCAVAQAQTYRLGDEADEIATVQTALKKLKLYTGDSTGHFGEKTETAIRLFQSRNHLATNGILSEETLVAICEKAGIDVPVSSGSSTSTSTSTTTKTSSSTTVSSGSMLRYDSSGDAVLKLQQDLQALGYYSGTISGHFGSLTEAAVMNFQRKNGLSPDGIAGTKTLDTIASALGSSTSSSSSSSSSSTSSTLLKHGTQSPAVRTLQENLKALGYYTGSVTGNFGNLTKDAVFNFQKANGLSADGIAGAKTLAKIASMMSGSSSSSASSSSSSSSSSSKTTVSSSSTLNTSVTLQKNSKSNEVLKLQQKLAALGYYTGQQTGNFGSLTEEAVKAYQKAKGLTADGIAGKKTLAAINADVAGGTVSSTTSSSPSKSNQTKMANDVIYSNFYNWRRNYKNGDICTVYDFSTGYSWRLRVMSSDAHMDAEPLTAEDTATMIKAFGGKTTWTPKAVWVTFPDGKIYLGSTHDTPHDVQHITNNNFKGHVCVHFPIPMETANKIGSYATSHQECITEAWNKTLDLRH